MRAVASAKVVTPKVSSMSKQPMAEPTVDSLNGNANQGIAHQKYILPNAQVFPPGKHENRLHKMYGYLRV